MVQVAIKNPFAQMFNFGLTDMVLDTPMPERLTLAENQHYALPASVASIRVLSGTAWVSHLGNNILLYRGQTMNFQPEHIAVVTSAGYKSVRLELNQ